MGNEPAQGRRNVGYKIRDIGAGEPFGGKMSAPVVTRKTKENQDFDDSECIRARSEDLNLPYLLFGARPAK